MHPSGKFAYVTNFGSNEITIFSINATTGALTPLTPRVATDDGPTSVTVDRQGRFAYVTNTTAGSVLVFAIDAATGSLTRASISSAGTNPVALTLDPSGRFVYVANMGSDNITHFAVDATTGALTPAGPPVNADMGPASVALTK
jgi:6-phosphogluconolactonase (cycloisomerase 2 family)